MQKALPITETETGNNYTRESAAEKPSLRASG